MSTDSIEEAARRIADAALTRCGPVQDWVVPQGYPDGLALCVIDAIASVGVRYRQVENIVGRYRALRGAAAETDGAKALLALFEDLGVDGFITQVGTRHRTSTHAGAPLKAQVIGEAAEVLVAHGVDTAADFRTAASIDAGLRAAWLALPGQGSAVTWRYALMLAHVPGVKPDRMVRRFVHASAGSVNPMTGKAWSAEDLVKVVEVAAGRLQVSETVLDHQIWRAASGRLRSRVNTRSAVPSN